MNEYWIGIDGTDSPSGGCTTWTMSNVIDIIYSNDPAVLFMDFPHLVRLNPNIPEKTRGNGALSIHIKTNLSLQQLSDLVVQQIKNDQTLYPINPRKKPGVVIFDNLADSDIYERALVNYLSPEVVRMEFTPNFLWPEWNQSHIGAIAAIHWNQSTDFTFELLGYRSIHLTESGRVINPELVRVIDKKYKELFSSYDEIENRELIAPSGPDPVYFGLRSNSPKRLPEIIVDLELINYLESYTIYKTNQGTDDHAITGFDIFKQDFLENNQLNEFHVFSGVIQILDKIEEIQGGHLFSKGRYLDHIVGLSWFEPTKGLRDTARLLSEGDKIQVTGSIRNNQGSLFIQIEFMMIVDAPNRKLKSPPTCECGNKMTSAGTFKGYKCRNCGKTSMTPIVESKKSGLYNGQLVYASKSAQRHLTRPLTRLHIRNMESVSRILNYQDFRKLNK